MCYNRKNINFYLVPYKDPALTRNILEDKEIKSHNDAMISVVNKIKRELNKCTECEKKAISCDINSEFYEFYKNRLKEEVYKKKLG